MYLITILQCYRDLLQYLLILLYYREVLHYREFITLLEQNIINDILQDYSLVFKTAILKKSIRTPLGILNGILANQIT